MEIDERMCFSSLSVWTHANVLYLMMRCFSTLNFNKMVVAAKVATTISEQSLNLSKTRNVELLFPRLWRGNSILQRFIQIEL
jgi:hypothetical protein